MYMLLKSMTIIFMICFIDSPQMLGQILQVWFKYPTLRKFIATCLTRFDAIHMGSYYYIFPMNVKFEELIALSLVEIFFNPL